MNASGLRNANYAHALLQVVIAPTYNKEIHSFFEVFLVRFHESSIPFIFIVYRITLGVFALFLTRFLGHVHV